MPLLTHSLFPLDLAGISMMLHVRSFQQQDVKKSLIAPKEP